MVRRLLPVLLVLLACPATAHAATLRAGEAVPQVCERASLGERPGTAVERYTARRSGLVTVTLAAAAGDWDLALFSERGRRADASASFGSRERALAYVRRGQTLVVQACRRTGPAADAELRVRLTPYVPAARRTRTRLVRVPFGLPSDLRRLEATGLDVTHAHDAQGALVVLYTAADERRLRRAGFRFGVVEDDLRAADRRAARADALRARASALPSGRTSYRFPADYATDLKGLADANPGLVRRVTIGQSLEGRPIEGVEIGEGVERSDDGRPVLAVLGLHHAREWPSGEMPMEFGLDLVARYRAGEPRVVDVLRRTRVLLLPIMNPDGFAVSRAANGGATTPADDDDELTIGQIVSDQGAYKRKNCRPTLGDAATPCALRTGSGVDLNRNYGAYWGGVGSDANPAVQNHRGSAPYSEPESEAFHRVSQTRPIVTVISHHTFTDEGVWLRQPGFCQVPPAGCQADRDLVPDEQGMKALGDAMGAATGWRSALGWDIGEITGATEDWNYFAAGAYGYTPEQRGPNFHPTFAQAVSAEFDGSGADAAGGVREALLRAAEQSADPSHHSVLAGIAQPGATLRLVKSFSTATSVQNLFVEDRLDLALTVPANGRFEWHVNPSTRPLASGKEGYVLRCEAAGRVVASREVVVDRGQRVDLGAACDSGATVQIGPLPATGTPTRRRGRPVLVLSRRAARARTINRTRRLAVGVRVDGLLRTLRIRLVDARRRTIMSARSSRISRDRVLRLKRSRTRRARPGPHRVVATAITRDGVAVRATRKVRIRR